MAAPPSTIRDLLSDDSLTICAISILAAMLASILHEGVGHAAIALATGTKSGMLTAVAWSSDTDSKLVAAGGTLVNLLARARCSEPPCAQAGNWRSRPATSS